MLKVSLKTLRLNAAHDGFFRGKTEPSISVRAYKLSAEQAALVDLGGAHVDKVQTEDPPCDVTIDQSFEVEDAGLTLLLAIALEEDSGDDVKRVRAALQKPNAIHLWSLDGEPEAWDAEEIARKPSAWQSPRPVDIDHKKSAMSKSFDYDKWIGASAFVVGGVPPGAQALRFVSGKNDWTLHLEVVRTKEL